MSYSHFENFCGASIKPSARPSIHRHKDCPFLDNQSTMGTHGLKSSPSRNNNPSRNSNGSSQAGSSANTSQGEDEVDNVMSKFRCPTPENCSANLRYNKRHSFGSSQQNNDCFNAILAKSLPTYLPSYSNCSEDFNYVEELYENQQQHSFTLNQSTPSFNRSRSVIKETISPNLSTGQYNQRGRKNKFPRQSCTSLILLTVVMLGVTLYFVEPFNSQKSFNMSNRYDQSEFINDLNDIGNRYGISDDSILRVQSGISTIFEKQDAGSFIFVYNSKTTEFDESEFNQLIHDIANIAAKYLRNDSASIKHAVVDTSRLNMQSHSELMNRYREEVAKTGVMVVRELDKVPSALAMAFHYYCDEYNPLVKKSAIFFTLDLANCSSYSGIQKSTHAYVEKCLAKKWNEVPNHKIRPLLTRVVDVLVDVTFK